MGMFTSLGLSAFLIALLAGTSSARALLRNGGFETEGGWTLGPYVRIVTEKPRTGQRCLRAEGDKGAAAEQTVWAVQPGRTYTVSGWMRTEQVSAGRGGFAFLALYEYDVSGRVVKFVDFAKVTGDTPWTEYRQTVTLAETTEYIVVRAGLYNALGNAWFDDINVVSGTEAQSWREPVRAAASARPYRVAVLADTTLPVKGAATPAAIITRILAQDGIPVAPLRAAELTETELSTDRFDLLIVPTGATFPVEARRALLSFLTAGGDLLCTGGYAFDHLVTRQGGRWISVQEHARNEQARARAALVLNGGFEDGATGWSAEGRECAVDGTVAASGQRSGRVHADTEEAGGRWTTVLDVKPGRRYLIGATCRTDSVQGTHYGFLAVYQYDENGTLLEFRDVAQLTGTTEWKRHEVVLTIHPSAGRVLFHAGLYRATGTLWVDDVTCGAIPPEPRINAHFGDPQDALVISPFQLTLFSPDQPLSAAEAHVVWPGWPMKRLSGPFRGYDATAQLRHNARWQALLEARDTYGRPCGAIGALVTHFSGPFQGSRWALFGVTNRDVFAGDDGAWLLRETVRLLATPVAAQSLTTDYALYNPGETATIRLVLFSPLSRGNGPGLRVSLTLNAPGRSTGPVHTESKRFAGTSRLPAEVAFQWKVPIGAPDFIRVWAVIRDDRNQVLDTIETGFCVRNEGVIASGPRIRFRDNAFEIIRPGQPIARTVLFGTDTYANMFLSPSCNPLTWFRDLQLMRDHGLHLFENLQYPPSGWKYTETEWRRMDALIQLSQRFGLPYMAGLLIGLDVAVDDATLEAQAALCRSFAERYRHVPGLIYYLNGDFRLEIKDIPDIRRLWNEFLQSRYGNDEALRQAWGEEAPEEPLGEIPVRAFVSGRAYSQRAHDTRRFQVMLVERWVSRLTRAIREVDTEHPITAEYYQRPHGGIDLRLTINGMDAANFGYFGPPGEDLAELLATIKWNDMRRSGQTVNIGEFGVKTHDAWLPEHGGSHYHIARTEREQRQNLWWVVHAAAALEVSKIQNWCWADDPDGVFPWGVAYNNPLRPKPVLRLWRNLRYLSELMPLNSPPAPVVFVMPDTWRLSVPEPAAWRGVIGALESLLATGVRFDVVNEEDVTRIEPGTVRLVVMPMATISTHTRGHLETLARSGCTVYVSGPGGSAWAGGRTEALTPAWSARSIEADNGRFVIADEAWETGLDTDLWLGHSSPVLQSAANPYFRLLALAQVTPDAHIVHSDGNWRAVAREGGSRRLIAAFPKPGGKSLSVRSGHHIVEWRTDDSNDPWPALAIMDEQGGLLGASGVGALTVDGKDVAGSTAPWMVAALDGVPLARSSRFVVTSVDEAQVRVVGPFKEARAALAELRDGQLVPLRDIPVSVTASEVSVSVPANELVLVTVKR